MIKFLQVNAHRSSACHDLVDKVTSEQNISMLLISEPNKILVTNNSLDWIIDQRGDAAIKLADKNLRVENVGRGQGFVWVKVDELHIFSCYISPNVPNQAFVNYLDKLKDEIRQSTCDKILLGGDFNAKSQEWGSNREDQRGTILSEWIVETGLEILNRGDTPTFVRGSSSSRVDITLSSKSLFRRVINWRVSDEENLSDHQNIYFDIKANNNSQACPTKDKQKWRYDEKKKEKFQEILKRKLQQKEANPEQCKVVIQEACEEVFGAKDGKSHKKPVYWWNAEVAQLRKACHSQKRKMVRSNKNRHIPIEEKERIRREYYKTKHELRRAINLSKQRSWEKLCADLNKNVWGSAYKIVCNKFKLSPHRPLKPEEKVREAEKLFPQHELVTWDVIEVRNEDITDLTMDEVVEAMHKMKNKKAPGPDGLSSEVVKAFFELNPKYCLTMFNNMWTAGTFPKEWKTAKLVLLEKGKKDDEGNMTYRPICLLNVLGKVMEHLIKDRLLKELREKGDLSEAQFGFREGRSTLGAMQLVMELVEEAKKRRKLCAITLLDVKNAFNSMPWKGIVSELKKKGISNNIVKILCSYFQDRELEVDDDVTIKLSSGVPQGSVIGPTLWNIYYDPVLKTNLPANSRMIAYADDLAIVTEGKTKEEIEQVTNSAIVAVTEWMENAQLKIAPQKTEVVLLASKRNCRQITVQVEDLQITSKKSAKYLGVVLDENLRMSEHVKYAVAKSDRVIGMLSRIMPNLRGPDNSKRKILASVVYSTLLYAAPAWGAVVRWKKYTNLMQKVQRKVMLRLCRAYRTSSTAALQVISGSMPVELMVEEKLRMAEICKDGEERERREDRERALKEELLAKWKTKWNNGDKGKWTRKLIKNMETWINRTHGEVSYELGQFLTGHGHFATFQFKINKVNNEKCRYCQYPKDNPEHTIFHCEKFKTLREECYRMEGNLNVDNIIDKMLSKPESWKNIEGMIKKIINEKEKNERNPQNR